LASWDSLCEFDFEEQIFFLNNMRGRGNFEMFAEMDGILPEIKDIALLLGN